MDPLYVVELDVASSAAAGMSTREVFDRLIEHTHRWLVRFDPERKDVDLSRSGRADLPAMVRDQPFIRDTRWVVNETPRARATQVVMAQPMENAPSASFVSDVTLFQDLDGAAIRIALGREIKGGLLTPATVRTIKRPAFLGEILRDADLECSYQKQPVRGEFQSVEGALGAIVPDVIRTESRLPLLMVDGSRSEGRYFAVYASQQLAGLAQVIVLDPQALQVVESDLRELGATIPDGGARLVWPSLMSRQPEFSQDEVARKERCVSSLMRMVATVSVAARGQNRWLRRLADETRRAREDQFAAALAAAKESGDASAEVGTLQDRVTELTTEVEEWAGMAADLENRVASLQSVKSELAYWKSRALESEAGRPTSVVSWDAAPVLEPSSLEALASFLTELSGGALVFTDNATKSWKQTPYPYVAAMRDHLVALARAATAWREAGCKTGGHLDEWFRIEWGVVMSPTDKGLVNAKADKFWFDGKEYSRVPHLKLDDHTVPSEVGRVYFARDSENQRFIVDHVGLKLYGI